MRPPSSSKNPKKSPDGDRSRKKKIKSKSAKRRRDSSVSSYSSSSDSKSEPDSRSRRKSSKSRKIEKRKKESKSKKSGKRRSRKKRYRRDSSASSYSDSSDSGGRCPTCSDSEGSRSPIRKKPKSRKRDRKSSRLYESKSKSRRRRHRSRSPSCSTCSSAGGSRGRSLTRSPSPSPVEEIFGRSRGRTPSDERFGGSHGQSPVEERFAISSRGLGPAEERGEYRAEGQMRRLRSVILVSKPSEEDEDKIIKAYDDFQSSRNDKVRVEGNSGMDLDADNGKTKPYDTQDRDGGRPIGGSLLCEDVSGKDYSKNKESETLDGNGGKEATDLELILRQKALENFKKFRGGCPLSRDSVCHKPDESYKGSQRLAKTSKAKNPDTLDDQKLGKGEAHSNELKARSIANVPIEPVTRAVTLQNTPSHLRRVQDVSRKITTEETSSPKDSQNKEVVIEPASKITKTEVGSTDGPASAVVDTENQNGKPNDPVVETDGGSQFEQKTFSRVRDGETVQVSYKVYIPKRAPALARRQLQR